MPRISSFFARAFGRFTGGSVDLASSATFNTIRNYMSARLANYRNSNFYTYDLNGDATYISDGGGDMYDTGNYTQVYDNGSLSGNIAYNVGESTHGNIKYAGLGYTQPLYAMAVAPKDSTTTYGWRRYGNMGADCGGSHTNYGWDNQTVNGFTFSARFWICYNAGDPSVGEFFVTFGHPSFNSSATIPVVTWGVGNTCDSNSQYQVTAKNTITFTGLLSSPGGGYIDSNNVYGVISALATDLKASVGI